VLQALVKLLAALGILALLFVVAYLLSDINTRRYRLAVTQEGLVVERGRFFPLGFECFEPADDLLRQAYAPIEVPDGEAVDVGAVFDERSEVDRALYARLRLWAGQRLGSSDGPTLELGIRYVKRLEILPSLSEGQRHDLRAMRADAALKQGEGLLEGVHQALKQAAHLFEESIELGTSDNERARAGLEDCHDKLRVLAGEAGSKRPMAPALWPQGTSPAPAKDAVQ
jgi:hypothetical protein